MDVAVLWSLVVVSVTGVLLGLRFRAPALIAATAATIVIRAAAVGFGDIFEWQRLPSIVLLVVTLQCAYLLGVLLGIVWRRAVSPTR
jgi:hypothetical protein